MHSKDYYISATSKNMQVDSSYHGESPILSQNPSFRDKRIKNQNVQSKREKEVKCWNKQCLAKGVEKNESKVLNRPIWLCSSCSKKFRLKQYCEYCEQIYSQEELDTEKWMECESKNCSRWVIHYLYRIIEFVRKSKIPMSSICALNVAANSSANQVSATFLNLC